MVTNSRLTRRQLIKDLGAVAGYVSVLASADTVAQRRESVGAYSPDILPKGIRSRVVEGINGLSMHVLEAGFEGKRESIVLLHGFPELAYSWRNVMVPLAEAGYHVIAPDQRGYGRTTGWDDDYDGDVASFRWWNLAQDTIALVSAFGYRSVAALVGHDFGSPLAAWCAVARPDIFRSVVLMSAPFSGTPSLPFDTANGANPPGQAGDTLFDDLAKLPRRRKHYQQYYRTREANEDLWHPPQGLHAFLRGYYHYKSADWAGNTPSRLVARTAEEMARMPTYYIMDIAKSMAETVSSAMPTALEIAANTWLPENHLDVYTAEFTRTGFQGGLNWYRGFGSSDMQLFAGRSIDQPSIFVAGASDWGVYQSPGALESMQDGACTDLQGVHLVEGAGHWVQQEKPEETSRLIVEFVRRNG